MSLTVLFNVSILFYLIQIFFGDTEMTNLSFNAAVLLGLTCLMNRR